MWSHWCLCSYKLKKKNIGHIGIKKLHFHTKNPGAIDVYFQKNNLGLIDVYFHTKILVLLMLGFKLISLYTVQPIFTQVSKLVPSSVILPPINQYFHPTGNESDIRIQLTPILKPDQICVVLLRVVPWSRLSRWDHALPEYDEFQPDVNDIYKI